MSWSSRLVVAVAALVVGACGFHLRGDFSYAFRTIQIAAQSPVVALEFKRAIEGSGGARVVDSAAAAEVILSVPATVDDKQVLSLSGGGRVREFVLTKRVSFRLYDGKGRDWLPAGEIVLRRTYSFNEAEVLAREAQEARLLKEMQTDAVVQILRQLQAARPPA